MTDYAIRLSDIASLDNFHPLRWMLAPFLTERVVEVSAGKIDGQGVVVNQDVPGRDWLAALEVSQMQPLPGLHYPIRIYRRERKTWRPITPLRRHRQMLAVEVGP